MKKLAGLLLLCMIFVSCATSGIVMYPTQVKGHPIEIYRTTLPSEPYTEIAQFSCNGISDEECLNSIIQDAVKIDADGIIIIGRAQSNTMGFNIGIFSFLSAQDMITNQQGYEAVAFKYTK